MQAEDYLLSFFKAAHNKPVFHHTQIDHNIIDMVASSHNKQQTDIKYTMFVQEINTIQKFTPMHTNKHDRTQSIPDQLCSAINHVIHILFFFQVTKTLKSNRCTFYIQSISPQKVSPL